MIRSFNEGLLPVSETFTSLQGEGPSIGRPSYFIRLYTPCIGCDFCDTSYSWYNKNQDKDKFKLIRMDELAQRVLDNYSENPADVNVVITGGEPSYTDLQVGNVYLKKNETKISEKNERIIHPVEAFIIHLFIKAADLIRENSINIEIETNGSEFAFHNIKKIMDVYSQSGSLQFNISPKWIYHDERMLVRGSDGERVIQLKNAVVWKKYLELMKGPRRYKNGSFQFFIFFKPVAESEEQMMSQLAQLKNNGVPLRNIYIMPIGKTQSEILKGIKTLFPLCQCEKVNLGLRLHVLYKSGKRGI